MKTLWKCRKAQCCCCCLFFLVERCQNRSGTCEKLWFFSPIVRWRRNGLIKSESKQTNGFFCKHPIQCFCGISCRLLRKKWMIRFQEYRFKFTRNSEVGAELGAISMEILSEIVRFMGGWKGKMEFEVHWNLIYSGCLKKDWKFLKL